MTKHLEVVARQSGAHDRAFRSISVARQPILNRDWEVQGFELLMRNWDGHGTSATAQLVSELPEKALVTRLTRGQPAWINLTEEFLLQGMPAIANRPHAFVLEILESVPPSPQVLEACAQLQSLGFVLALDDVTSVERVRPFVGTVGIVKVDWLAATPAARSRLLHYCQAIGLKTLAEKVETLQDTRTAFEMGYDLFQGYAIGRPAIVHSTRHIRASTVNNLRIISLLDSPDYDMADIERLVRLDGGLMLKVLEFANSASAAQRRRITEVRQAIVLLGQGDLRRIALLLILAELHENGLPHEITDMATTALLCELVAQRASMSGRIAGSALLVGALAKLAAMLGEPGPALAERLSLSASVVRALDSYAGPLGAILLTVEAFERGDWELVARACRKWNVPPSLMQELYHRAISDAEALLAA